MRSPPRTGTATVCSTWRKNEVYSSGIILTLLVNILPVDAGVQYLWRFVNAINTSPRSVAETQREIQLLGNFIKLCSLKHSFSSQSYVISSKSDKTDKSEIFWRMIYGSIADRELGLVFQVPAGDVSVAF